LQLTKIEKPDVSSIALVPGSIHLRKVC